MLSTFGLNAQQTEEHSRARIHFDGKSIYDLSKIGVDISHGRISRGLFIECDFSARELLLAQQNGFRTDILIPNVGEYYAKQVANPNTRRENCSGEKSQLSYEQPEQYASGSMGGYFLYEEMITVFESMATKYPHLILPLDTISDIKTAEGRPVLWTKLSGQVQKENDPAKRESLMTALHHAREPNSLSQMIYFLWYVLENYDTDPVLKLAVDQAELYFIPCVNPDGYIYNQTTNPEGGGLWRKNRFQDFEGFIGVDLNRNYDYFWGIDNTGSSNDPTSDTYRGTSGFSEAETQAVKYLCEENEFFLALNYHTYGNLLIHPWGYNDQVTAEDSLFKKMARDLTRENDYVTGTGTETVGYIVNGDSDDWMYGETSSKPKIYSYTPEAGPNSFGFWPPEDAIIPINDDCLGQNLVTLFLTARVAAIDRKNQIEELTKDVDSIYFNVLNYLPKSDSIILNITSLTPGLEITHQSCSNCHSEGNSENAAIVGYELNHNLLLADSVVVSVEWSYNGNTFNREFSFDVENQKTCNLIREFDGNESDFSLWSSTTWRWTADEDHGDAGSYTDSPFGEYSNNSTSTITLSEPFDLTDVDEPTLSLYMKYELEQGFDFVNIEGSSDGINYTSLCGQHSVSRNSNQGEIFVYTGFQDWIKEELDISAFSGGKLYLSMSLVSDPFVTEDGIYIDDIKIENCNGLSATTSTREKAITISPNPTDHEVFISSETNIISCSIYTLSGKLIQQTNHHDSQVNLPLSHMESGLYIFKVQTEKDFSIQKIVVQH